MIDRCQLRLQCMDTTSDTQCDNVDNMVARRILNSTLSTSFLQRAGNDLSV